MHPEYRHHVDGCKTNVSVLFLTHIDGVLVEGHKQALGLDRMDWRRYKIHETLKTSAGGLCVNFKSEFLF